jgi:hypothetical protein
MRVVMNRFCPVLHLSYVTSTKLSIDLFGGLLYIHGAFLIPDNTSSYPLISHYINYLVNIPNPPISKYHDILSSHSLIIIKFTSLHIHVLYPCWMVKSNCITVSPFVNKVYHIILWISHLYEYQWYSSKIHH